MEHVMSCKKLRGRFVRHDEIVELVKQMVVEADMVAQGERFRQMPQMGEFDLRDKPE